MTRTMQIPQTPSITPMRGAMPNGVRAGLGYETPGGSHKLGLYLLIVFTFLAFGRLGDFAFPYLHLPFLSSVAALAVCVLTRGIERSMQTKIGVLLLAFTFWVMVGMPFSVWKGGSWETFSDKWVKSLLAYFLVAGLLITSKDVRKIMNTLAISSVVIVILARLFKQIGEDGRLYVAGQSTLSNPNDAAQLLLVGLPFLYLIMITSSTVARVLAFLAIPPVIYTISATGSRGALLAIVAVGAVIFWGASPANKLKGLVVGLVLIGGMVVLTSGQLKDRYRTIFSKDASNESDQMALDSKEERWFLLKQSVRLSFTHPLFGVGIGQFSVASKDDASSLGLRAPWRETHNSFTEVSSETGLPGFLLYAGSLVLAFRFMIKLKKASRNQPRFAHIHKMATCMFLSLLSFAVTSFFSSVAYAHYLPSLLGLTVGLYQAARYEMGSAGIDIDAVQGRGPAPARAVVATAPPLRPAAALRRG